nr:DUF1569 domain-containing protein [Cytophagales bacterium]
MHKTVLDISAAEGLVSRVGLLKVDTVPLWGTMNAAEMLGHCNVTNLSVLKWKGTIRKASVRQGIAKFFWMNVLPKFPRNVRGKKVFDMKGQIASDRFEEERKIFVDLVRKFHSHQHPLTAPHPVFGPLNTAEWGKVIYKHLDHHLRQFGI